MCSSDLRLMIIARMTVALTFALTACLSFPTSHDEVSRVSSPAGDLDAVLVETNGGATTSFGYLVYVLPRSAKPSKSHEVAWLYAAGRNEHAYGANLRWVGPSEVVIEYQHADEAEARKPTIRIGGQTVTVVMHGGVSDSTAPAGGMLYNLERNRH